MAGFRVPRALMHPIPFAALLWDGLDVLKWGEMEGEARQCNMSFISPGGSMRPYTAEPWGAELLPVSPEPPRTQLLVDMGQKPSAIQQPWASAPALQTLMALPAPKPRQGG